MNMEKQQNEENLPKLDKEKILEIVQQHNEGLSFEEGRESSDENGVWFLEVISTEPDSDGYIREYTYSRKSIRTGEDLPERIYLTYYEDGIPVTGENIF
jgi:hypothetical protein